MLIHGVGLAADDFNIKGPTSFRKAMTFAESGWLLCWATAWLLPLITARRWERDLIAFGAWFFAVGDTLVMSLQVWRGVPSHYNWTTWFDSAIITLGGVFSTVFMITIIVQLWATFRPSPTAPSLRLSIQVGTAITLFGTITGWLMTSNMSGLWQGRPGTFPRDRGLPGLHGSVPDGAIGGNMVMLHAWGVHGLQLAPLAAFLLTYSLLPERARLRLTAWVCASAVAVIGVLSVQVFRVLPTWEMDPLTAGALAVAGISFAAGYALVGWHALRGLLAAPAAPEPPQALPAD